MVITAIHCFAFVLFSFTGLILVLFYMSAYLFSTSVVRVNSQTCQGISQYDQCSTNSACGCFHMIDAVDTGICGFLWVTCSQLASCESSNNTCSEPDHVCVRHPRCHALPVCYPLSMTNQQVCPPGTTQSPMIKIPPNATWTQNGTTVGGSHEYGNELNQLYFPIGLYVDADDQSVLIADYLNHRIVEWKSGATSGQVVAGGNGPGTRNDQLNYPSDVIVDKETDSLIICDLNNRRVVRWPRRGGTSGETIISNVYSYGLTMNNDGFLYVSDYTKHEVRRWRMGETEGTLVAGGNGGGERLDQLYYPWSVFVDRDQSVYVSDSWNHRVMKWVKDAKEGIVVAGGRSQGNTLAQFNGPHGVIVDQLGTVYVADGGNHRIMRWSKGATQGSIVVGGNGGGTQANQLSSPTDLSFDLDGHLYVADQNNHRVQRFSVEGL